MTPTNMISTSRTNTMSSIRGKISLPIPMADDEEFPIRTPGSGIAMPLGRNSMERMPQSDSLPRDLPINNETATVESKAAGLRTVSGETPVVPIRGSSRRPATSTKGDNRLSTQSAALDSDEKPKRRSTFKSALSKLFGKKKGKRGSGQRDSQLSMEAPLQKAHQEPDAARKRSTSLPLDEYNRALRSHSPTVENLRPKRGSVAEAAAQQESRARPRGATMPGYKHENADGTWALSPRPMSSSTRGKMALPAHNPLPIGMAITSGSHPHRRSRSLSHMSVGMSSHAPQARRRSEEIRYWRQSHDVDALSPMSSSRDLDLAFVTPRETAGAAVAQPQPFNFGPIGEMAGMKITQAASLDSRVTRLEVEFERIQQTVLSITRGGAMTNMIKLQQPPRGRQSPSDDTTANTGLETAQSSGTRMYQQSHNPQANTAYTPLATGQHSHFEMSDSSSSSTGTRPAAKGETLFNMETSKLEVPATVPSVPGVFPDSRIHSIHEMPSDAVQFREPVSHTRADTTRREVIPVQSPQGFYNPSNFPYSKHGSLTAHHYTALLNLIQAEQKARAELQDQVFHLQNQLNAIMAGTSANSDASQERRRATKRNAYSAKGKRREGTYDTTHVGLDGMPTSAHGPRMGSLEDLPAHAASTGGIGVIEDATDAMPSPMAHEYQSPHSRTSPDRDTESLPARSAYRTDNPGRADGWSDEEEALVRAQEDNFRTPQEQLSGAFEDESTIIGNMTPGGKARTGASRTLSLSQMTERERSPAFVRF